MFVTLPGGGDQRGLWEAESVFFQTGDGRSGDCFTLKGVIAHKWESGINTSPPPPPPPPGHRLLLRVPGAQDGHAFPSHLVTPGWCRDLFLQDDPGEGQPQRPISCLPPSSPTHFQTTTTCTSFFLPRPRRSSMIYSCGVVNSAPLRHCPISR